ncbi:MAG: hypothetical protein KUA35_08075 [Pseudodesulfovibrio sp.]|uniref:Uncharacterized protein n=1 Tax=Pseudodesulfovibrio aespoeensis (strain ATCC 700646 / DSM 10631 / Aspo-2) TaxID=643562 RepID=E6VT05_PSEA9|nr:MULTISPECIES: hypothetical protein [Pseudodesulfovibrio]MBU4243705.1 hypothetical protein [Pseudomonadota bacterium]ADU62055.1 hypothetical protein Daes_1039 [Pseudodesulfovibrio aespoeensis Aspo-2]MBU4378895.1 hypothetical protein [Pseudomonadota bacterium]MBU4474698.1 hypothetical protein [Pseudomonadota bacterium]MBU4515975.1 hypothetical protein [Pseudomonadota bacterium]
MDANLILGLAAGYHYGDMRPFLASLGESGFRGVCVLFVSPTTRDLDRVGAHGVTVLPMPLPAGPDTLPANALRYFLYRDFLLGSAIRYRRILLTDVRDVIFQADPFDAGWADGLNCVLEDPRTTISQCPHNSRWVRQHQGEGALASVADSPVSCSGTVVADHDAMLGYLDAMIRRLIPFTPGERMAGYDQGVHNVLVHTGALPSLTLHDNDGPVLTLASTAGEPAVDAQGRVRNARGQIPAMVHQYDRKPSLFARIRARHAPPRP